MKKFKKLLTMIIMFFAMLVFPVLSTGCSLTEKDLVVRVKDNYIQWQQTGDEDWTNLISVDEIKELLGEAYKGDAGAQGEQGIAGVDGREVEFQKTGDFVQWRYKTEDNSDTWKNLIAIDELKGEKGETGPQGEAGQRGETGPQGEQGEQGDIGPQGPQGEKGEAGEDGHSPYIGENGNWWIGETDTGVKTIKSIYDIYCENKPNYKKTEAEWLNDFLTGELLLLPTNLGDVNLDGKLTFLDFTILNRFLNKEEQFDNKMLANSDVNADGFINETDYKLLKNAYLINSQEIFSEIEFPILEKFGDINLDGKIDENDYVLLIKANNKEITLTGKQMVLSELDSQITWEYSNDLIILRDYIDGKIENLDAVYHFISLDFDGYENNNNIDTCFYVKEGETIENLTELSCDGLTFNGWIPSYEDLVNNDTIITSKTPIETAVTLIPSWTDVRKNVSQNLQFELNSENTYSLKGLGTNTDVELVIPAYYNGLKVTSLSMLTGSNEVVTSIVIPRTIKSIHGSFSSYFTKLEKITVDENNFTWDSRENCNAIIHTQTNTLVNSCKNTVIPSSVTTIGTGAFRNSPLIELELHENISKIDSYAFNGANIEKLIIRNSESNLGNWWNIMSVSDFSILVCDNINLANYSDYTQSELSFGVVDGVCNLDTIYFKEGLNVNEEFYFEFEQVESDLEGYAKYTLK